MAGGFVGITTLVPTGTVLADGFDPCVICGDRGVADVVANMILFLPLGAGLAIVWGGGGAVVAVAGLVSAAVELAQFHVPGRHPALGDVLANVLGAVIGVTAIRWREHWMYPSARLGEVLSVVSAAGGVTVVAFTGYALSPALPLTDTYWAMWTPQLGHLQDYAGSVHRSALDGREMTPGVVDPGYVRKKLLTDRLLEVQGAKGDPPSAPSAVFAIYDDRQQEVIMVGAHGEDLVLRYRLRAHELGMDQPALRLHDAFTGIEVGDRMELNVRRQIRGYCITVNGAGDCGVGFTAGSGWSLLQYVSSFPPWLTGLLDAAWVAALLFPIGYWPARRRVRLVAVAAMAGALTAYPLLTGGLVATPLHQFAAAGAGLVLGHAVYRALTRGHRGRVHFDHPPISPVA
jgi:hypothetical protein